MIDWVSFDNGNVYAFYGSSEWRNKRKAIRMRDHNMCQRCLGKWDRQKRIQFKRAVMVHHIVPVRVDHDKALDDQNLVSLCFACHEEVEGRTGANKFKPKQKLTEERW